jgi:hypothetical protein
MNMIVHQDIRVNLAATADTGLGEALEKEPPVHVPEEAERPVVAALDDVKRDSGDLDAG